MTDSKQDQPTWPNIKTDFRKWTPEEVNAAVHFLKTQRAEMWQTLIEEEICLLKDEEFERSDTIDTVLGALKKIHPEADFSDCVTLRSLVHDVWISEAGRSAIDESR